MARQELIGIQTRTVTRDSFGGEVERWIDSDLTWASVAHVSAAKRFGDQAPTACRLRALHGSQSAATPRRMTSLRPTTASCSGTRHGTLQASPDQSAGPQTTSQSPLNSEDRALAPTGPCPKIATVSTPVSPRRLMAWKAVPVPQATAAPWSNGRSSGIFTQVDAGHRRKS